MKKFYKGMTAEEIAELEAFDRMVDESPLTDEDYKQAKEREAILELGEEAVAKKEKERQRRKESYQRRKRKMIEEGTYEAFLAKQKKYREENKGRIKKVRAEWYIENKEAVRAHQDAYRKRVGYEKFYRENGLLAESAN